MDVAPIIINDRTLVPIMFVSEALGYQVEWDEKLRTVFIKSKDAWDFGGDIPLLLY
jgi:hypothetical protein